MLYYLFKYLDELDFPGAIDNRIIIPPIVGVPFFCICPSKPKSRISSPICCFCKIRITLLPIIVANNKERIIAQAERNVM